MILCFVSVSFFDTVNTAVLHVFVLLGPEVSGPSFPWNNVPKLELPHRMMCSLLILVDDARLLFPARLGPFPFPQSMHGPTPWLA